MRVLRIVLSLAFFYFVACDPVQSIDLKLVDETGAALDHVRVTETCPNYPTPTVTETHADGIFRTDRIPAIDPKCTYTIAKDGFQTQTFPATELGITNGANAKTPKPLTLKRAQ